MQDTLSSVKTLLPVGISAYTAMGQDYVGNYSLVRKNSEDNKFKFHDKSHKTKIQENLDSSWIPKPINDLIQSPTFKRLIYLATSALPLILTGSIVIGAISIAIAICFTIYGVVQDTKRYREMQALKEEGAILSSIAQSKNISETAIDKAYAEKQINFYKPENTVESFLTSTALNVVPIAVSALSGNYFQAGAYAATALANSVSTHRNLNAYEFKRQQIKAYNEALASVNQIGNYTPGMSLESLKDEYQASFSKKGMTELNPNMKSSSESSFVQDMANVLKKGFKISKFQKSYTPDVNPYLDKYAFSHEATEKYPKDNIATSSGLTTGLNYNNVNSTLTSKSLLQKRKFSLLNPIKDVVEVAEDVKNNINETFKAKISAPVEQLKQLQSLPENNAYLTSNQQVKASMLAGG